MHPATASGVAASYLGDPVACVWVLLVQNDGSMSTGDLSTWTFSTTNRDHWQPGKAKDGLKRLQLIHETVSGLVRKYKPTEFAIEAPFFGKNVQRKPCVAYRVPSKFHTIGDKSQTEYIQSVNSYHFLPGT